jgi:Zn-dependent metalloprotease
MGISRSRALGALVQTVVAVTALGTPVLAGTAALGANGASGAHGRTTTSAAAAANLATEVSGVPAAYAVTNGAPAAPVKPTGDRARDAIASGAVKVGADKTGKVHYVTTPAGKPLKAPSAASGPAAQARAQLNDFAKVFGVKSGSSFKTTETLTAGKRHVVRFQQTVGDAPVIGGELAVTVDGNGGLIAINGEAGDVGGVSASGSVTAATAKAHAIAATARSAKVDAGTLVASAPELSVYDPTLVGPADRLGTRPVWRVEITSPDRPDVNQYVLIDARTGNVALSFSQVEQAKDRRVCDFHSVVAADPTCTPALATRVEGQGATGVADVDAAYDLTGAVHDFYVSLGRDGIDDHSMPLISTVNFCPPDPDPTTPANEFCPYANAFWNGTQMTFGSGYASGDDVVGHELTHGVTQFTSNLLYYYQSGAINESISDVMGELFDQSSHAGPAGNDTPAAKWLIGEDLPGGGAIRNMADPGAMDQPDSMSSPLWNPDWMDNGGVHFNSGVGNKAAFLMTDGGTLHGVTVTGIGDLTKVARIWLGADELLTSGADYADLANALVQSCLNLGFTTECTSVSAAVDAVQMAQPPSAEAPIPQAEICPALTSPVGIFGDDFNRAVGTDLGAKWAQNGGSFVDDEAKPSDVAGNALLMLAPFDTADTLTVATSNWITLPAGDSFLHFNHLDAFDFVTDGVDSLFFDQGYVEIATSTAPNTWVNLGSAPWINGPVTDFDGGPVSFGGDSRGWTSSRAALKAYAGKQVKLRFRVTTDDLPPLSAGYGWWLDNISVYTCAGNALTADFNGDGWGDVAVGAPNRDVAGQTNGGAVVISYGGPLGLSGSSQLLEPGIVALPAGFNNLMFGTSVATGDFNHDTFTDLAIGAPGNNSTQGFVTVLYGSIAGITATNGQNWGGATFVASGYADAGYALAAGDFNNDTFVDLAVGVDGYSSGKGGVGVLKGSALGLTSTGMQWFTQDTAGVPGAGENNDHFGRSLATGDFNGDSRADLAVGVPNEAIGSLINAGSLVVLPGAAAGLTATGSKAFDQNTSGVPGAVEAGDLFGSALAAADVTKDGRAELAVGAPGEAVGAKGSAGTVNLLKGSSSGLTGTGAQGWTQDSTSVPGSAEAGDRFGAAVALGDLNGDGVADLVAGTPGEAIGAIANAGGFTVLPGTLSGLTGTGSTGWEQNSANVPDTSEAGDLWASAVRVAVIVPATPFDLIVGAPGEDSSSGAITVIHGGATGVTGTGSQLFTGANFAGGAEAGARLGASIR